MHYPIVISVLIIQMIDRSYFISFLFRFINFFLSGQSEIDKTEVCGGCDD